MKKIMNPISYVISFVGAWLASFPLSFIAAVVIIGFFNVTVFHEEIGAWFWWYSLLVAIGASFSMAGAIVK